MFRFVTLSVLFAAALASKGKSGGFLAIVVFLSVTLFCYHNLILIIHLIRKWMALWLLYSLLLYTVLFQCRAEKSDLRTVPPNTDVFLQRL